MVAIRLISTENGADHGDGIRRRGWLSVALVGLVSVALSLSGCRSDDGVGDGGDEAGEVTTTSTAEEGVETTGDPSTTTSTMTTATTDGDDDRDVETLFPDVVGVDARLDGDGTWTFNVTLSSPYDSPARYADAWRVVGPDGVVYGERILLHDHAGEQPFTRSQSGIAIPDDVDEVTVEGRDQISGWGGQSMTYTLDRG